MLMYINMLTKVTIFGYIILVYRKQTRKPIDQDKQEYLIMLSVIGFVDWMNQKAKIQTFSYHVQIQRM